MRLTFVILLTDSEATQDAYQKHGQQDKTNKQKSRPLQIILKKPKNQETGKETEPSGQVLPARQFLELKRDKRLK
jgi:hypothetical protein